MTHQITARKVQSCGTSKHQSPNSDCDADGRTLGSGFRRVKRNFQPHTHMQGHVRA